MALSLALFVAMVHEHAFLCDDAFISFRYAENLLLGRGLVFNVGERVEGYTNFAWVLELALSQWVTGASLAVAAHSLSLGATALTVIGTLVVARGTSRGARGAWLAATAALFLLSERSFAVWSTSGLETRQFTLLVLAGLWVATERGAHRWGRIAASVICGLSALTRPEGLMLGALALGAGLGQGLLARRLRVRDGLELVGPFAVIVAAHLAFRVAYYGELAPNTYYAKHVRPWWDMGAEYLGAAAVECGLYLTLPLACVGAWVRARRQRSTFVAFGLAVLAAQAIYVADIGGDHFEFRPLDLAWPILAIGAAEGVVALAVAAAARLRAPRTVLPAWAVLVVVTLAHARALEHAQWALSRGLRGRDATIGLTVHVDPERDRLVAALPFVRLLLPMYDRWLVDLTKHSVGLRQKEHAVFEEMEWSTYGGYSAFDRGDLFPRTAVAAHGNIGVIGWALPSLTLIDLFGLTDRTIARNPVRRPNAKRAMAHDRAPPPGYLDERGVDIEIGPFCTTMEEALEARTYALELGPRAFLPFDSARPEWVRAAFARQPLWGHWLGASDLANDEVLVGHDRYRGRMLLGGFDAGLDGWTEVGGAQDPGPAAGPRKDQRQILGQIGRGLLNSFDGTLADRATAEWVSPPFVPERGDVLTFLVGGGKGEDVGVELHAGEETLLSFRGAESERLRAVVAPLSAYAGRPLHVLVLDHAKGRWGHVLADHFMIARRE